MSLVAGADLQLGHRDVSGGSAVELDSRTVVGILDRTSVQLVTNATADDAGDHTRKQ